MDIDTDIRRIATSKLVAREFPGFQKTKLLDVLDGLAWREPLILKGPKSTGKTLNVEQWAHMRGVPFLRKSCTSETGDRQLLGGYTLKSFNESYFALGVLATAVDVANETGSCVLVLEEINALNEEAQKVVNSLTDYRREVDMPHVGMVYRLHNEVALPADGVVDRVEAVDQWRSVVVLRYADEHYDGIEVPTTLIPTRVTAGATIPAGAVIAERPRLWVVGTMNPGYGGTYELNEDFRSRCKFITIPHMAEDVEHAILLAKLPGPPTSKEALFITGLQALAKETRGGQCGYALAIRDLEQALGDLLAFGNVETALKILADKFDEQYMANVCARVMSVFSVDLTTVDILR